MNSKWLGIGLTVSLVLNLLLVGFIIGRISAGPGAAGPDPVMAFPRFARDLPEDRRAEIRPHVRQHLAKIRPNRRAVHVARKEINEAILSEPFDAARLEQALGAMEEAQRHMAQAAQNSFVHFVGALTPAERKTFVLRNQHPRHLTSRRSEQQNNGPHKSER